MKSHGRARKNEANSHSVPGQIKAVSEKHQMNHECHLETMLQVYQKSPKEVRLSDGVVVDLFSTASFFCPVAAFKKYLASLPFSSAASSPVFRTSGGAGYTGAEFNGDLKSLLKGQVDYSKGKISIHPQLQSWFGHRDGQAWICRSRYNEYWALEVICIPGLRQVPKGEENASGKAARLKPAGRQDLS